MRNKSILRRLISFSKPYIGFYILAIVFTAVNVWMTLYAPILVGRAIDLIVGKGNVDFDKMAVILVQLAVVIAVNALMQWLAQVCTNKITYRTVKDIRTAAFEKLQQVPLSYIDSHSRGDIISRVITDVDQISDGLMMSFTQLFSGVATILGTIGFMLSLNVGITLIVVLITPLSFFVAAFIAKRSYKMFSLQAQTRGEMTSLVEESIGSHELLKAYTHEDETEEAFSGINQRLSDYSLKATFISSLTNPSTRFINGLVYAGVGVFGALSALSGGISVGQLSCFLTYANQYTKPFNEISGVFTELQNAMSCAKRVFELIDTQGEPSENAELNNVNGDVTLSDVSFSYSPDTKLIENLSLAVKSGERIAIVGPTGCGKTTIINLLMRFYDVDSGEITVSGMPIRSISRHSLRRSYGMVLQETWLKSGTIFENIAYGKPDATMEEVVAAAKSAHAYGFISRLPNGFYSRISDDETNISQGQKQLLCIARVMLCLPPMLILDEATSSIDTMTESRIQCAFAKMMKGRTSFIVAHRLSTIREADCILVMNNGKILEQGTHQQLIEKKGFYAELYNSQFQS